MKASAPNNLMANKPHTANKLPMASRLLTASSSNKVNILLSQATHNSKVAIQTSTLLNKATDSNSRVATQTNILLSKANHHTLPSHLSLLMANKDIQISQLMVKIETELKAQAACPVQMARRV
jgi:hypothetical protein